MQAMHELAKSGHSTPLSEQAVDVTALLQARIIAAHQLRLSLQLPSAHTNVYRLINSEGDRLSGLIVHVLNDQIVVASTAAWAERCLPLAALTPPCLPCPLPSA